jgi:DNA-binding NtrC family response regulator
MQSTPAKIVVIEDHPEYLDYLGTLLQRAGYIVAAFRTATAAMRYIEHCSASVVITDVFMPDMDGFEVLKDLQRAYPGLPVIAISGDGLPDQSLFLEGMRHLGARAAFAKPLDTAALLATVRSLAKDGDR